MKHNIRTKTLSILLSFALMLSLLPSVGLTAYADNTETLLTTITATGKEQASYNPENVATVSFSYTAGGSSAYLANWGWWGYGWSATVNAAEGYTITKCVFYDDANRTAIDSEAPFVVETTEEDKTPKVNGNPILADQSKGIKKIEVFGYATPAHTHDFTYTADGATITATCTADGCDLTDSKVTLTIGDPTNIYYDDKDSSHEFTLEGLETFNTATGKTISADDLVYYKGDYQSPDIKNNKVKGATYKARLTVEGVRAEHSFTFTAKPVAHTHIFTYSAEGNVITATCTQNAANMEACDLENKQATLTLNAPAHKTYGDGLATNATITGEIPGVDAPTINYRRSDTPLSSAPTDAGTYTAWCQLGNATASVEYTIKKAVNPGYTALPQANEGLVYTGEAQALITAGTPSIGQIAYTAGTDPDNEPDVEAGGMPYSYSVPKMTDAGTYYVWCRLDGGKNYESLSAQAIKVTIAKADITPTISIEDWTYGETAKTPSVTGNTSNGEVTYTYAQKDTTDFFATVPSDAGDYTVKAVIAETNNYLGGEAMADFTIVKADPTAAVPTGLSATYGQTLADVTLTNPDGNTDGTWAWADDTQSVGNAGENTFKANFTPADTANYNTVNNIDVTVTVAKADPTYTVPTGLSATYGDTLADVTLPECWTWADDTQSVGNTGENTFKATFTPEDTDNYNIVENIDVSVTVGKAEGKDAFINTDTMSYSDNKINIEGVAGQEYIIVPKGTTVDEMSWDNAVLPDPDRDNWVFFDNLTPATEYEIYTRTAETENSFASEAVKANVYTTLSCIGWNYDSTLVGATITIEAEPETEGLTYKWYQDIITTDEEDREHHALTEIPDATGTSYTFREEDVGKYIAVKIFAGDSEVGDTVTMEPVALGATIVFDSMSGSEIETLTGIGYQAKIAKPADPILDGYAFGGWYKDAECTEAFDFDTPVTENITLYAKWTEISDGITYLRGDANLDGTVDIIDIVLIRAHIVNMQSLTGTNLIVADANADETVDIIDVAMIRGYIVKETPLDTVTIYD